MYSILSFFFSSRRRHTRWNCDWSSDVCSSDLPAVLDGVDNGQQENAQSYRLSSVPAFNGRALVILRSAGTPGRITVSAASAGLTGAKAGVTAVAATTSSGRGAVPSVPAVLLASSAASGSAATADASYSGSPATIPAAMLDG